MEQLRQRVKEINKVLSENNSDLRLRLDGEQVVICKGTILEVQNVKHKLKAENV